MLQEARVERGPSEALRKRWWSLYEDAALQGHRGKERKRSSMSLRPFFIRCSNLIAFQKGKNWARNLTLTLPLKPFRLVFLLNKRVLFKILNSFERAYLLRGQCRLVFTEEREPGELVPAQTRGNAIDIQCRGDPQNFWKVKVWRFDIAGALALTRKVDCI